MTNAQATALNARITKRRHARERARKAIKSIFTALAALLLLLAWGAAGSLERGRIGLLAGTALIFGGILLGALCAWAARRV